MIGFENFERRLLSPRKFRQPRNFIFKHVGKPFDENERQNVILEFWRIFFATNLASRIPKHLLHRFGRENFTALWFRVFADAELPRISSCRSAQFTLTDFFQQGVEGFSGSALRFCPSVFPAVDSGE